jgi:hypothetical protein
LVALSNQMSPAASAFTRALHRQDRDVEIVAALTGQQACLGKVALGPPAAAFGNFQLGERREEPRCRPALFVGAFGKLGPKQPPADEDRAAAAGWCRPRRPGRVELLAGIECVSSRPVRKIIVLPG